jgi:hypothetical protein
MIQRASSARFCGGRAGGSGNHFCEYFIRSQKIGDGEGDESERWKIMDGAEVTNVGLVEELKLTFSRGHADN